MQFSRPRGFTVLELTGCSKRSKAMEMSRGFIASHKQSSQWEPAHPGFKCRLKARDMIVRTWDMGTMWQPDGNETSCKSEKTADNSYSSKEPTERKQSQSHSKPKAREIFAYVKVEGKYGMQFGSKLAMVDCINRTAWPLTSAEMLWRECCT